MLVSFNFTENLTVDVAVGIFRNVYNNIHSCFSWQIYQLITIKNSQFEGRSTDRLIFWRNKETVNSCLIHCSHKKQKKKLKKTKKTNNKHFQMLLVFRKKSRRLNYRWSSVLKTCTTLIVGIFEQIC